MVTADELRRRSALVCGVLCQQPEYQQANVLMLFLSTPQEIDTSQLAIQAWADLKRVLAPRVTWDQRRMLPIEIQSLATDIEVGYMGIREPVEGPPVPTADIDLVVVPGLAFDEHGNRIVRGRGFYDQFLAHRDWKGIACGFAFEKQVLPQVPMDERDMQVDMLVTDAAIRRFGP